jgi:hypothetical protein
MVSGCGFGFSLYIVLYFNPLTSASVEAVGCSFERKGKALLLPL